MNKLNWGVIGCGGIARIRTIPGMLLAANAECIAVMDRNPQSVADIQAQFGIVRGYHTLEDFLADPDIDVVYIATPLFCHKEQVEAVADSGKHILLEKPMGLTVAEAEEMKAYCEQRGVMLGVGFMMRFHEAHQQIQQLIGAGEIGEVVSAYAKFNCWSDPAEETVWRQKKATGGGGAMMDMGIHCIDLLQYMTGLQAQSVVGMSGNQIFTYIDVEDAATCVMKMQNGAMFTVEAHFNISEEVGGCKFEIYGTKGSITAEGTIGQEEAGTVSLWKLGEAKQALTYEPGNLYTKEVEAFSQAVLTKGRIPVTAKEAILDQRIVEAVYESCDSGRLCFI